LTTSTRLRWLLAVAIALLVTVVPIVRYRWVYRHAKRFREVERGLVYRSGWMSAPGFIEAIREQGIRTVINLMEDEADPALFQSYFFGGSVPESELCRQLKVNYINLAPDLLTPDRLAKERPAAIEAYLRILDDPKNYPVLLHCRAGLHRTGIFTAIYRMEYQGWTPFEAWREMKANGFGEYNCFADNPYISQYILNYRPGLRAGTRQLKTVDKDGIKGQESAVSDRLAPPILIKEEEEQIFLQHVPPLPRP
jgi:hypothetical protein